MPIKNRKSFEKKENKCIRLILDVGLVFLLFGGKKKKKKAEKLNQKSFITFHLNVCLD